MKQLKEDYERRLKTVMKEIAKGGNDLTINRLGTKASCYRTFLTELDRAINFTGSSLELCGCKEPNPYWIGEDNDMCQICFKCRKDLA